jgi:hypothetical protein
VLPRSHADAEAQGVNALINFSTRPTRRTNVAVRYRYNKRDVQTPVFNATEYVRFDAVPEEIEEGFSPQFDNSRHLLDANFSYTPAAGARCVSATGVRISNATAVDLPTSERTSSAFPMTPIPTST